jgi:hypothetical protein
MGSAMTISRGSCSRASLGELATIMTHSDGTLRAYVLFELPHGLGANWPADLETVNLRIEHQVRSGLRNW